MDKTEIHIIRAVLYGLSVQGRASLPRWGILKVDSISPAEDPQSEVVSPPRRTMSFTRDTEAKDDISLFFTEKLGYPFDESQEIVEKYFAEADARLDHEDLVWSGLGSFSRNTEGKLAFDPADQWIQYINPGLNSVPRFAAPEQREGGQTVEDERKNSETLEETLDSVAINPESNEINSRSWIWLLLTAIAFLACLFWIVRTVWLQKDRPDEELPVAQEFIADSLPEDGAENTIAEIQEERRSERDNPSDSTPANHLAEASEDQLSPSSQDTELSPDTNTTNTEATKPSSNSTEDQCVVVVGAFAQEQNANKLVAKLKADFAQVYRQKHSGLLRVGVQCDCSDVKTTQQSLLDNYKLKSWFYQI